MDVVKDETKRGSDESDAFTDLRTADAELWQQSHTSVEASFCLQEKT